MASTTFLKASLALWQRRARFRQARLRVALRDHDAARAAKWKRQLEAAQRMIARRRRELEPDRPIPASGFDVSNNNNRAGGGHTDVRGEVVQLGIDYRKAKQAGHRFVWIKSGEGDWNDPFFAANVRAARAAGLKVGGYHFLRPRPGRTGAQEAAFFIQRLRDAGLGKGDLLPAADIEKTKLPPDATRRYTQDFLLALTRAGYTPCLYTYTTFNGGDWGPDFHRWPLWLADYDAPLTIPKPWTSVVCHQHDDHGTVPGVTGDVDLNRTTDLRKLLA